MYNEDGYDGLLALQNAEGVIYEPFLVNDSIIHFIVPKEEPLTHITFYLNKKIETACFNNVFVRTDVKNLDLSNFTNENIVKLTFNSGSEKKYTLIIYDLPVLIINTPNAQPIESKEVRIDNTEVKLVDYDGLIQDLGTAGIRGRGNSTWDSEKKPYNLILDKKHDILGMPKSKHWLLLANAYFDRTQLHNAVAFEMARLTDYIWVQQGKFVELILNGEHRGLYYLCEKIRVEKGKIDIDEMTQDDVDGENLTGGYLLESAVSTESLSGDFFTSDYFNKTGVLHSDKFVYTLGWEIKSPDESILPVQKEYIVNALNYMESLIANEETLHNGKYRDYFDIETAINWWLVEDQ